MRRAKRKLGEEGRDEHPVMRQDPLETGDVPGSESATAGAPKSVESMLREFSAVPDADRPAGAPYDQLWQLSMADPHTGLANQLLLLDRLTQALARRRRHGGEVMACHIELDNLTEINADFGYATGNEVLNEVARRLTAVLRAEDSIGRVGSNQLVVVVAVTDEQVVGPLLRRLQHTLDEPVPVGNDEIRLRSSLGVALAEDSESAEDVLARADRSTRVSRR